MDINPVEIWRAVVFGSISIVILAVAFIANIMYHNSRRFKISLNRNSERKLFSKKPTRVLFLELASSNIFSKLTAQLDAKFHKFRTRKIYEAISLIRQNPIDCVITYLNGQPLISNKKLSHIKVQFPSILLITISTNSGFEDAHISADTTGYYMLNDCNITNLENILAENTESKIFSVNFKQYGIDINECSRFIQKALKIMEERYIEIKSVKELADEIGISREFLSRQFKKYCHINVKKLLTQLKLQRAIYLMQNPGLNLKEIQRIVGFSNIHHFNKSFQRHFNSSPKAFRKNTLNKN